jgi:hypothetical protein
MTRTVAILLTTVLAVIAPAAVASGDQPVASRTATRR